MTLIWATKLRKNPKEKVTSGSSFPVYSTTGSNSVQGEERKGIEVDDEGKTPREVALEYFAQLVNYFCFTGQDIKLHIPQF